MIKPKQFLVTTWGSSILVVDRQTRCESLYSEIFNRAVWSPVYIVGKKLPRKFCVFSRSFQTRFYSNTMNFTACLCSTLALHFKKAPDHPHGATRCCQPPYKKPSSISSSTASLNRLSHSRTSLATRMSFLRVVRLLPCL